MSDLLSTLTGLKIAATAASGAVASVLMQAVGSALAEPHETTDNLWAFEFMGVSLAVLATCLLASLLQSFKEPPAPEEKMAWKFMTALFVAMVGGWTTVFFMGLPFTTGHIGDAIPTPAVGAVFTLCFEFLRNRVPKWIDSIVGESIKEIAVAFGEILKSWLKRGGSKP